MVREGLRGPFYLRLECHLVTHNQEDLRVVGSDSKESLYPEIIGSQLLKKFLEKLPLNRKNNLSFIIAK